MADQTTYARGLPRLDEFDQEFGHEPGTITLEHRRKISWPLLVGAVAGAAIISLAVLAWLNADGLRALAPSGTMTLQSASSEVSDEQLARLTREIAALKRELGDLAHAHQQAIERIASLQADQQLRDSAAPSSWYSDLAALSFESASQPRPSSLAPPSRRAVTARPEAREIRRGENAEPLRLEAPQ
jgi:hypothetical protein